MNEAEKIINELKKLDSRIQQAIEKILGKNPNQQQLLQFINSNEFNKMLEDLGLNKIVQNYVAGFDRITADIYTKYKDVNINLSTQRIASINYNTELIKNSNGRTVLGYFQYRTEELKKDLINSIINGRDFESTRLTFGDKIIGDPNPSGAFYQGTLHHFTDANVGTVINTAYKDYQRTTVSEIFKDKPSEKFFYFGPVIPTSSDECEWLINNQSSEGYTRAEIDVGIETPFTYQYGELAGQVKKIYWSGRFPNYNCLHEWQPIKFKDL